MQSYSQHYQQLELLQSNPTDNFKLYLVKQVTTGTYRMSKKTSLFDCTDISQDQLLNEVKILKQLNHPHIIKYYDIFLEEDDFIVVLQFCQEGDLQYYLNRKKQKKETFSQKLILSWVLQILMGLEYIHSQNIIHRMICSRNIYMNHQGDLKLGSFGGAKMLEHTLQKAMTVVGSAVNLSPQVVEGNSYDNKIDIWGLGCLIYQLATHQHPFKMTSLPDLYEMIVKSPPQDLPVKYSKYLNSIYKKMMKKNPNFRPSASELLQEEVFIKLMKEYTKKKKIDSLDLREVIPKQLLAHKNKQREKQKQKQTKPMTKMLPPLQNNKSPNITQSKIKTPPLQTKKKSNDSQISRSKQKEKQKQMSNINTSTSPRLPSLSGRTSESQQQSKQTTNCSPKLSKQSQSLPSIQKQKQEKKISPKIPKQKSLNSTENSSYLSSMKQKQREKQKQAKHQSSFNNIKNQGKTQKIDEIRQKQIQKQLQYANRLTQTNLMQCQYISLLCQIKLQLLQKKYSPNMSQIFQQTIQFQQEQQ